MDGNQSTSASSVSHALQVRKHKAASDKSDGLYACQHHELFVRVHLLCPDMKKCWNERGGLRSRRWKAADLDCCGALAILVCGGLSASGLIDALYLMLCCMYRYSYSEPWTESAKVLPRCPRRMFDDDVTSAFNITIINASRHLPLPLPLVPLRLLNFKRRSNSMFLATTASLGTLQAPNTGDLFFVHF